MVSALLDMDPEKRPTAAEVLAHPWMKGETPDHGTIRDSFEQRLTEVREATLSDESIPDSSEGQDYREDYQNHRGDDDEDDTPEAEL